LIPRALVGVFYDDGIYLALARSLAEGHGYRHLYLPLAPAAVHYPVLYPALLAALWKVWPSFPANVALFRAANAVFMGLFAAGSAWYLGRRVGLRPWASALLVAAAATAIPMLAVATVLFSEPLFLVLTVAACWTADVAGTAAGRRALVLAALAGLLAGLAVLCRSIGVAVVAGVVLALLRGRRWRVALAALVPAMLCLAPWAAWVSAHRGGIDPAIAANYGSYGAFLTQGGLRWLSARSVLDLARPLGAITLGILPLAARAVVGVLAAPILATGLVVLARRAPAAGWMTVVYLAIVFLWPYGPDRFLWGILPWLAFAFVLGVRELVSASFRRPGPEGVAARVLVLGVAVAVMGGFAAFQVRGFVTGAATEEQTGISETMTTVLSWVRSSTDTSAVIAGEDEALIWLYTGRRAVPSYVWRVRGRAAESLGPDSLRSWLTRAGATHLVLTGPGSDAAQTVDALLARSPGFLHLVYVAGPVLGFRVARAP